MRPLLSAVQFLTRLPVPDPGWGEGRLRAALPFFPLAGLLVGAIGAAVWWAASLLPAMVAAGLAIGAMLLVTGAMHEDGLGDIADGLGGHWGADRALEIMRDPRVGSYALVTVVMTLGLRWAALGSLGVGAGIAALLISATVSRGAMVVATRLAGPARPDGLGRMLGEGAGGAGLGVALAVSVAVALVGGLAGFAAMIAALAVMFAIVRLMVRRVGGMTGDGYGAVASLAETAALVVLSAAWSGA